MPGPYGPPLFQPPLLTSNPCASGQYLASAPLVELFDEGREEELVRVLLERYYDPLYRHSEQGKHYALTVDATDPTRAAEVIASWIA